MGRMIQIDSDKFEHLLNCMCNQKYLHGYPADMTENAAHLQEIIDKAWNDGMTLLSENNNRYAFLKYFKIRWKKLLTGEEIYV